MTRSSGEPISNYRTTITVGPRGPPLMEDHVFLEDIQHVGRGRIPERKFHAKGVGVHGYFEVTNDITKYCDAKIFSEVGKRTPQFTRFSIGISQLGSADTIPRGLRGMSTKFYTEEGNWDLSCLTEPVLIANEPGMLLSTSNAGNAETRSNLPDPNRVWDFATLFPESAHFFLLTHTDRGFPDGYRHANQWAINNYMMINQHGETIYARFHLLTDQGVRNLDPIRAGQLAGVNPDYFNEDLIQSINRGDYPSFTMFIQVMTDEQATELDYNPFNVTKIWSQKKFPLIPVGKLVMNRNVENHWDETEQSVYFPGNLVPGLRPAPGDRNFHGRIMIYRDTQLYRLGVNHGQLPINRPLFPVRNYQREGRGVFITQGSAPNYFPNSYGGPVESVRAQELDPPFKVCGDVMRHEEKNFDPYSQPGDFWRNVLDEEHKGRVVVNLTTSLRLTRKEIQERAIKLWENVDEDLGRRLAVALQIS